MNPQNQSNWEQKLKDLEAKLQGEIPPDPSHAPYTWQRVAGQFLTWFQTVPKGGQIVLGVVGLAMGLTLLKTVFQLVSLLISLAILGIFIYLGYRFLVAPHSANSNDQ